MPKKERDDRRARTAKCKVCNKFISRKKAYVDFDCDGFHYTHPKCVGNIFKRSWLSIKNFIRAW